MRDKMVLCHSISVSRLFTGNVCAFLSAVYAAFVVFAVLKMKAMVYKREVPAIRMKEAQPLVLFLTKAKQYHQNRQNVKYSRHLSSAVLN